MVRRRGEVNVDVKEQESVEVLEVGGKREKNICLNVQIILLDMCTQQTRRQSFLIRMVTNTLRIEFALNSYVNAMCICVVPQCIPSSHIPNHLLAILKL